MRYYVDAYNLIFRAPHGREGSLKKKREELISRLATQVEWLNDETILVFDSQHQSCDASRHHYKNLEIYYTDEDETADDYIIKSIKVQKNTKDQTKITVVTSDLYLAWRARREQATTLSIEEYLEWLRRRYKNKMELQQTDAIAPSPFLKKELPRLLPESRPAKQTKNLEERKPDFEYYMEKFGGDRIQKKLQEADENKQMPELEKKNSAFIDPLESEFERWLRIFGG